MGAATRRRRIPWIPHRMRSRTGISASPRGSRTSCQRCTPARRYSIDSSNARAKSMSGSSSLAGWRRRSAWGVADSRTSATPPRTVFTSTRTSTRNRSSRATGFVAFESVSTSKGTPRSALRGRRPRGRQRPPRSGGRPRRRRRHVSPLTQERGARTPDRGDRHGDHRDTRRGDVGHALQRVLPDGEAVGATEHYGASHRSMILLARHHDRRYIATRPPVSRHRRDDGPDPHPQYDRTPNCSASSSAAVDV